MLILLALSSSNNVALFLIKYHISLTTFNVSELLAPDSINNLTMSSLPLKYAICRGVVPY